MMLWNIVAIPFVFFLVSSIRRGGFNPGDAFVPFWHGVGGLAVSLIVYWIFSGIFSERHTGMELYFYSLVFWNLLPVVCISGTAFIVYTVILHDYSDITYRMTGFAAGFFTVLGVLEWIFGIARTDIFWLFAIPLIRIILMLSIAPAVSRGFQRSRVHRISWFAIALIIPFITATISYYSLINLHLYAFLLAIPCVAVSAAVYFITSRAE